MELESNLARLFDEGVGDIDDAEAVEEGDDAVAASRDGDFVPVVFALIADFFDEFVVGGEPSAGSVLPAVCQIAASLL